MMTVRRILLIAAVMLVAISAVQARMQHTPKPLPHAKKGPSPCTSSVPSLLLFTRGLFFSPLTDVALCRSLCCAPLFVAVC